MSRNLFALRSQAGQLIALGTGSEERQHCQGDICTAQFKRPGVQTVAYIGR